MIKGSLGIRMLALCLIFMLVAPVTSLADGGIINPEVLLENMSLNESQDDSQEEGTSDVPATQSDLDSLSGESLDEESLHEDPEDEDLPFLWEGMEQGVRLIEYTGNEEVLVIPSQINDLKVLEIGPGALSNKGLTAVTIPGGLTRLGEGALAGNGLMRITIEAPDIRIDNDLLEEGNNLFRGAYREGGAGIYEGTQTGVWYQTEAKKVPEETNFAMGFQPLFALFADEAETLNLGFEEGLAGWTTVGGVSVDGQKAVPSGVNQWNVQASGTLMASLTPEGGTTVNGFNTVAETLMLSSESQAYVTGQFSSIRTVAYIYKDIQLEAGEELSLAWNYVATDYEPFNDASLVTLVNTDQPDRMAMVNGFYAQVGILGATVRGTGNYSTGSYGSTGWQTAQMKATTAGTYRLGFAVFNLMDTGLSPWLFIDDGLGTTLRNGASFDPIYPDDNAPPPPTTTSLIYAPQVFVESEEDDGSIETVAEITLINENFSGSIGEAIEAVEYQNIPEGLTPIVTKTADNKATLFLQGQAQNHDGLHSIDNMTVIFGNGAFAGNDASKVIGYDTSFLSIAFQGESCLLTFESNDGSPVEDQQVTKGEGAVEPSPPARAGYDFLGWYKEVSLENPWDFETDKVDQDTTLYANWSARSDTPYTVKHYLQNLEGDHFTLYETEGLEGLTGAEVSAEAKTYAGFEVDPEMAPTLGEGIVQGDGSLVMELYYLRLTYPVSFLDHQGRLLEAQSMPYGAQVNPPVLSSRSGYRFLGWEQFEDRDAFYDFNQPIEGALVLQARWRKNSTYTPDKAIVLVNGQEVKAGDAITGMVDGEKTLQLIVDPDIVNQKILELEAASDQTDGEIERGNLMQIPVIRKDATQARAILKGDSVKALEENNFSLSILSEGVEYLIPAEEIKIEELASKLGVSKENLKEIQVEIRVRWLDQESADEIQKALKPQNLHLLMSPISFEIIAYKTNPDGERISVAISRFNQYVERRITMPEAPVQGRISTGIVLDGQGRYAPVPTFVHEEQGLTQARINALTNSTYALIWNPVEAASVRDHWAKASVEDMASRLAISDLEAFIPDQPMTKGQFAQMLTSSFGLYGGREGSLGTFPSEEGGIEALLNLEAYGLLPGDWTSSSLGEETLTREEAMMILSGVMDIAGLKEDKNKRIEQFSDVNTISEEAYGDVAKVVSAKIFNGKSSEMLKPGDPLTQAEGIAAMRNLLILSGIINAQ